MIYFLPHYKKRETFEACLKIDKALEHVRAGARTAARQVEFVRKYKEYEEQHKKALNARDELLATKAEKERKALKLNSYLQTIKDMDSSLPEWSEDVWMLMVESAIVNRDGTITFKFISGTIATV